MAANMPGEQPERSKNRQVFTQEQLRAPGLRLFGHCTNPRAIQPLGVHQHEDCLEFVLVVKGEESYFVGDQSVTVASGQVFVTQFNEPHKSGEPFQGVSEYYWFQLNPFVERDFLWLAPGQQKRVRQKLLHLHERVLPASRECMELAGRSFRAFLEQSDPLLALGYFCAMLGCLLFSNAAARRTDEGMEAARRYIDAHLLEEISLQELSDACGLSLSALKHRFKEYTGRPPRDYINYQKIGRAKELLLQGQSVTQTAMALGFASSEYFSVVFKRYTNQSPAAFGRRERGKTAP